MHVVREQVLRLFYPFLLLSTPPRSGILPPTYSTVASLPEGALDCSLMTYSGSKLGALKECVWITAHPRMLGLGVQRIQRIKVLTRRG